MWSMIAARWTHRDGVRVLCLFGELGRLGFACGRLAESAQSAETLRSECSERLFDMGMEAPPMVTERQVRGQCRETVTRHLDCSRGDHRDGSASPREPGGAIEPELQVFSPLSNLQRAA